MSNQAVTLYNDKPVTKNYYQYPADSIMAAIYNLSYPAFRLWLIMAGQTNGFTGAMKLYCQRANISSRHYKRYRDELIEKGFLEVDPYNSITVLYPPIEK